MERGYNLITIRLTTRISNPLIGRHQICQVWWLPFLIPVEITPFPITLCIQQVRQLRLVSVTLHKSSTMTFQILVTRRVMAQLFKWWWMNNLVLKLLTIGFMIRKSTVFEWMVLLEGQIPVTMQQSITMYFGIWKLDLWWRETIIPLITTLSLEMAMILERTRLLFFMRMGPVTKIQRHQIMQRIRLRPIVVIHIQVTQCLAYSSAITTVIKNHRVQ